MPAPLYSQVRNISPTTQATASPIAPAPTLASAPGNPQAPAPTSAQTLSSPVTGGTQQTNTPPGPIGSTPTSPPNPYNLPDDLVQGMTQNAQLQGVLQDMENQKNLALQGNLDRMSEIKSGYEQTEADYARRTQELSAMMEGFGTAQREQLAGKFAQQGAGLTQEMINRGMYNTGALDSARRGLSRDQQYQQLQLEDALTRQKMDYLKALTGEELQNRTGKLGFLERIDEQGPNMEDAYKLGTTVGGSQAEVPDYLKGLGYTQPAPWGGQGGGQGGGQTPPVDVGNTGEYKPIGGSLPSLPNVNLPNQYPQQPDTGGGGGGGTSGDGTGGGGGGGGGTGTGSKTDGSGGQGMPEGETDSSGKVDPSKPSQAPQTAEGKWFAEYYRTQIAPRLAREPQWEWWNDLLVSTIQNVPDAYHEEWRRRLAEIKRTHDLNANK